YQKDVKPLLQARCGSCHGSVKQKGDLRLDAGALILKGGSGPVVVPGKSDESELIARVLSPDDNERMPPEGARLSAAQVDLLRGWIDAGAAYPQDEVIPRKPSEHWAFQPLQRPKVPQVRDRDWPRNPIDAFVLAKFEARQAQPPAQAAPTALLRRVSLDLIGLPPTIAEQQRFAERGDLDRVIDELLKRPEYGERWARHWLDVARYADSNGYERDAEKPFVWRYRDYVIEALNQDKPFDRFVLEQIAGDELPDASLETYIATGFLRLGHWDDEPADPDADRYDQLDDIVSTTGQAFLGLTIGCARCHDHKFEPLSTRDYYSLVSVFNPLERPRNGRTELPVKIDETDVYAWREPSANAPVTHVLLRGSPGRKGDVVAPAVPAILVAEQPAFPAPGDKSTQRRLGLARWIADGRNPLTARVIVNRVWQQHFGQGLVTTANDFGLMGAAPSNPELLDWLADWFTHEGGWSLKRLHRLILTSRTWQTEKTFESLVRYRRLEVEAIRDSMLAVSGQLNPKRFGPAMKPEIPKAAIEANTDKEKIWQASDEREASRRSIYAFIKRGLVVPMFETLDLADTVSSCPQRQVTTVAPQALSLFNGDFSARQARHFATRLRSEASDDAARQVSLACRLALCREPTETEQRAFLAFLQEESLEELCRVVLNLNEFVYPE
ncbi:MAG TPA: PSD1 and planctomycete cytochrome C domain-containing protein, partial [Planctomycetaceae bacterium]|nr:PSD1 and planctomycete cytochrome C domain-containing protein [Planctomycetaceae bacterium]